MENAIYTIVFQIFHMFLDYLLYITKYTSIAFAKYRIRKKQERKLNIFQFLLDHFDLFRGNRRVNKTIVAKGNEIRDTCTPHAYRWKFLTSFDRVTFHPSVTSYLFEEDPASKFSEGCAKILSFFQLRRQY